MKSFKQYLKESQAQLGDCFPVAGRFMLHLDDNLEKAGMKMVHALIQGEGELEGRRFGHAFNKLGDVIFDKSNGNDIMTRKENYFKQGGINPNEKGAYVEYDQEESMLKMARYHHWGPWDLDESLMEEIPDEQGEIGKKKLGIPPQILQIIQNELTGKNNEIT